MTPTCDLYDHFLDQAGVLPAELRAYGGKTAFHGPAQTIKTYEVNTRVREAVSSPGEGRVLVVDGGASLRRALLGDRLGDLAVANGWAGVVIWGALRDVAALAQLDIGIMALGHTPRKCVRSQEGETGGVIVIAGTPVAPGDMIVADADGALVIPKGLALPD